MAVRLLQDTLNTYLFAFAVPVYQIVFQLRLRDTLLALLFAGLAAGIVRLWTLWPQDREEADSSIWRKEALLLGLCSSTVALFPVHFGDRHVAFAGYSRFTWTPAIGAAIVLVALLFYLSSRQIRSALLVLLILLSSATHFGNATRAAQETETLRRFWWQVTWRAPGIQKGTTLIVHYAATGISEDYVIWGPANLIYYPEQKNASPIPLSLQAEIMNENTVLKILSAKGSEQAVSRGVLENKDFSNILLISQPTRGSCVQVLDGLHPELSSKERNDFMLVAPYSNISNIITEGNSPIPPPEIFGPEPAHEWCYYFEKAQLARQRGDWQEVARLGDEALEKKLNSDDWVEWLVFLQAYAHQDRHDRLRSLAPTINEDRFLKKQVCDSLNKDGSFFQSVSPESQTLLDELFCQ